MKKLLNLGFGWVGVAALTTTMATAQDAGFNAALKLRAGYGLSGQADNLSRNTFGLGFDFGYTTNQGRFGAEICYQYKPGNQYLLDLSTMPKAPGVTMDPAQSVDSRKNQVGGLALRLSFERPILASAWSWRAGIQVGGSKYRQEYIGDVTNGSSYEDTYNGTLTKTTLPISPFVGIGLAIDPEQALEFNLVSLGYTSVDYVHVAGTVPGSFGGNTAQDTVATHRRSVPQLEFTYVLRF